MTRADLVHRGSSPHSPIMTSSLCALFRAIGLVIYSWHLGFARSSRPYPCATDACS